MSINPKDVAELLRLDDVNNLYHRESGSLEFKEQFNLAGLPEYFKDFAALANSGGGFMIFGISNNPRQLVGLTAKSLVQFNKIDPERISRYLMEIFSSEIRWEQCVHKILDKSFGIFYIQKSISRPVIAQKNEGDDQVIKDGDIYYRYGGRTQRIRSGELQGILQEKLDRQLKEWMGLMSKIAKAGPANAAVMDVARGIVEKGDNQMLVIDKSIVDQIQFIREGSSSVDVSKPVLKLAGEVSPVNMVEVVKIREKQLTELYPLSALELAATVKKKMPMASTNRVWEIIKDNNLKTNPLYAVYVFRNRAQSEQYRKTGKVGTDIPSIYNAEAVKFCLGVLKDELGVSVTKSKK